MTKYSLMIRISICLITMFACMNDVFKCMMEHHSFDQYRTHRESFLCGMKSHVCSCQLDLQYELHRLIHYTVINLDL